MIKRTYQAQTLIGCIFIISLIFYSALVFFLIPFMKMIWTGSYVFDQDGNENPSQAHQNTLEAMFFNSLNHEVGTSRLKATRWGKAGR